MELKEQIQILRDEIDRQGQQMDNLDRSIQKAGKYAELEHLTPYALRELVKAVYLEKVGLRGSKRRFNIKISYDFIGYVPLELRNWPYDREPNTEKCWWGNGGAVWVSAPSHVLHVDATMSRRSPRAEISLAINVL